MKLSLSFVLSVCIASSFCFLPSANADISLPGDRIPRVFICNNVEINNIYIPLLREVADWDNETFRPYAINLCQLTHQKIDLQKSIKMKADLARTGNWRICKEVIPGTPNPTDAECVAAYSAKINGLIDQCISFVGMGHNPHNVGLLIDPLTVEVSCLKATDAMFL